MQVDITSQRIRCILLTLLASCWLPACGLNQREKLVAETNQLITQIYEESESLAEAIYELPEEANSDTDFTPVLAAYESYRNTANQLSEQIHILGQHVSSLQDHLRESFDPSVERAFELCDSAVAVFQQEAADDEALRDGLTSLCVCIQRYAQAVTQVSQAFARIAG